MDSWLIILWVFVVGACVGSFLNVVIYRLPRGMSLWWPPSHCPQCEKRLGLRDNIPIFGWLILGGKCRYCKKPFSFRYPAIELITGLLFAGYYYAFFVMQIGMVNSIPMYALDMILVAGLLAVSIIDAELYIIPASIPWFIAGAAIILHAFFDSPSALQNRLVPAPFLALSAGAGLGLLISIVLLQLKIIPLSFPEGDLLEHEREELRNNNEEEPPEFTPAQIRREMQKEMVFLIPPMLLGGISMELCLANPHVAGMWVSTSHQLWLNGALGSLLGGMAGGFLVWMFRIIGSYCFGREAMGLGDMHLMFGIGAALGIFAVTLAFFLAPFLSIAISLYLLVTRQRHQLPYAPYLSLATAIILLCYAPVYWYAHPSLEGFRMMLGGK